MRDLNRLEEGLSYDDVLLVPARSDVLPRETDVTTQLTKSVRLNIPILSAAMDTVTEASLAIAVAREGGLGVIHRNLSIEGQASEVDRVKRSESGIISDPITLSPEHKVRDATEIMSRYHISGIPITNGGKLVGILTNRDLNFLKDFDQSISEVMTKENLVTAPEGTTLEQAKSILHEHRIEKLPLVDEATNLKGLITIKDIRKIIQYPNACKDAYGRLRVGAAVGTSPETLERAANLVEVGVDIIFIDTAHGHSAKVLETLEMIKERFDGVEVIAGNVATAEGARDLIDAGVDAVKVGVGPASICTTRVVSGAGVPQVTAIVNCARVAQERGIPLIADGAVKWSGDITKALVAGANCVMMGSWFAGTDESPGETVLYEGRSYKVYRGMGSLGAMKKGSSNRYFQDSEYERGKLVPEGIEGRVSYRGSLATVVHYLVGGLRAGMGYCGARNIPELQEKGQFMRMSPAGLRESHPHGVTITEEPPNYPRRSDFPL